MADPLLNLSVRFIKQRPDDLPLPLCGIYTLRNTLTGQRYVGSTTDMRERVRTHLCLLRKGAHHSTRLQEAWDKYGGAAFVYETLALCRRDQLLRAEQFWLDHFRSYETGYNQTPTAGSCRGTKRSQSAIEANRAFLTGRPRSEETKRKMAAACRNRSPETRAKLSAAAKGNKHSVGRPVSAETRAKIGAANKGNKSCVGREMSIETRAKIGAANSGPRKPTAKPGEAVAA